ncbi:hypothetical protein GN958_ATG04357, partial [Phytophthora infestans]
FNRVAVRPSGLNEDPELAALALQISDFAPRLASEEHTLATGLGADYTVNMENASTAVVSSGMSSSTYEVDTQRSQCNCVFMQKGLLPCRHVMFVRSRCKYETVLPPMRLIFTTPVNNIAEGEVSPGGLRQVSCAPLPKEKALSRTSRYTESKALSEINVDRMALQSTPTYRVAIPWMEEFYEALKNGTVLVLRRSRSCRLSGKPVDRWIRLLWKSSQVLNMETTLARKLEKNEFTINTGRAAPKNETTSKTKRGGAKSKFAERPLVNGITKAQCKRAKTKVNYKKAIVLVTKYREERVGKQASFDEVAALFDGPYSIFRTKAMLDTLVLSSVEVRGKLSARSYAVGQGIPVVKSIPLMNQIMEAIKTIKIRNDIDLLAYWPDYGFAAFDQLDGMASVIEARNHLNLVMRTLCWIDDVECRVSDIRKPFSDARSVTKFFAGRQLLDFRENLWLHTTSILVSMMVLRDEYPDIGFVSPRFHEFVKPEQRKRVAGGFGAGNLHVGNHWVAFLVDRHILPETNKGSQHNYTTVERSVRSAIEGLLHMEDMLTFEKVEYYKQKDGSSCGVWCITIFEILLIGASWDDCLYNLLPYLRMRF